MADFGMNNSSDNKAGISEKIEMYKNDVEVLVKFLPWLTQKSGETLSREITPEGGASTMKVPVYDSTLLNFVRTAQKTKFINRNYVYTYSRYRIKTTADELKLIDKVQIMEIQVLGDILSKYVLKGMVKGNLWTEAMQDGVFLKLVNRMKELIEFWTLPM